MIIFLIDNKIVGHIPKSELTEERKQEILAENPFAVWVDAENIEYPDKNKEYLLTYENGEIVYTEIIEDAEPLSEAEQMQIETYLNTAFIADMMALNM